MDREQRKEQINPERLAHLVGGNSFRHNLTQTIVPVSQDSLARFLAPHQFFPLFLHKQNLSLLHLLFLETS